MKTLKMIVAGCALFCAASHARADEVTLVFATVGAPNANFVVDVLHPWAENLNKLGKGQINIEVRDGTAVASPRNYYDRVINDVVQIAWGTQSSIGGQFLRSAVAGLPFIADKSEDGSVALWRLSQSNPVSADYGEVVPLYLVSFPQGRLHLTKPMKSIDDLPGLKVLTTSKITSDAIAHLGATPLTIVSADIYASLQRGTANGTIVNWAAMDVFKLAEVTSYHVDAPLGGSTGMVIIARKKFDALPAAARQILMENSGETWSRKFGTFWDGAAAQARRDAESGRNHVIVELTPDQRANWQKRVTPVIDAWVRDTPDGAEVLAAFRREMEKLQAR
jgi:TRAP-type C4-dicarboxylate transport system substrate-binding protein